MKGCLKGKYNNEKDLKEEIGKGLGDVNVSVASNVDLNDCSEKETNIIKEVLDRVLPGLFPKVIDALGKKREKEQVVENTLGCQNEDWLEHRGLCNLNERHQVHAFVLGFIQEYANPAIITFHPTQSA